MNDKSDLSDAEIRHIDARWKSDMDKKVDRLCVFAELYQDYLELCLKREVGREKLRAAVMEKTLGAVILTGLAMLGAAVWAYIREHLK